MGQDDLPAANDLHPSKAFRPVPRKVELMGRAVKIAAGLRASYAVLEGGSVWAWGHGECLALGTPEQDPTIEKHRLPGLAYVPNYRSAMFLPMKVPGPTDVEVMVRQGMISRTRRRELGVSGKAAVLMRLPDMVLVVDRWTQRTGQETGFMMLSNRRRNCLVLLPYLLAPTFFSSRAMGDEMTALTPLAGTYRDGVQKLTLQANGRFSWEGTYFPAGGDAGMGLKASGRAKVEADSMSLLLDAQLVETLHGGPAPAQARVLLSLKFYPMNVGDEVFLLDEKAVTSIVNRINAFGASPIDASPQLHRERSDGKGVRQLSVDPKLLVPAVFARRVLDSPLQGKVLRIGEPVRQRVNVGGWMREPVWRMQSSARLLIDLGSSRGVFKGMQLRVGAAGQLAHVEQVQPATCEAQIVWIDEAPQVGEAVSSSVR